MSKELLVVVQKGAVSIHYRPGIPRLSHRKNVWEGSQGFETLKLSSRRTIPGVVAVCGDHQNSLIRSNMNQDYSHISVCDRLCFRIDVINKSTRGNRKYYAGRDIKAEILGS